LNGLVVWPDRGRSIGGGYDLFFHAQRYRLFPLSRYGDRGYLCTFKQII
jgi:hypothetical protein